MGTPLTYGKGWTAQIAGHSRDLLTPHQPYHSAAPGLTLPHLLIRNSGYLYGLRVEIDQHGKMPDVVIHHVERNWLILIEAVTFHGPVNILHHNQLKRLFASSTAGLVFVTTFLDRTAMREHLPQIAWETEVWVAEAPDHLIHFNDERFLGSFETGNLASNQ